MREGCWPWTAGQGTGGYGRIWWDNKRRDSHRVVYELLVGPIPEGLVIDHLCHTDDPSCPGGKCAHRLCQNPQHMRLITLSENVLAGVGPAARNARKDACDNGHPYTPETVIIDNGTRRCLLCRRDADRRRRPTGIPRQDRATATPFYPRIETPETRALDARIVELRQQGLSFAEIGGQLGISRSNAHKRFSRSQV